MSTEKGKSWPLNTPGQEWSDFARQVMPPNASDTQRLEMRKSFLAGYLSAMVALRDVPDGMSEDEGAQRLEAQLQSVKEALEEAVGTQL